MFGGRQLSAEEEKEEQEAKKFDLLKYDGVKALKIGRADYAERCFREALKLRDDLEVHEYLSQSLLRMGQLDEAQAELQQLAQAQPQNVSIQQHIAQVAYMREDYAAMSEACERCLQIDADNVQAYYLSAQAQQAQHNPVAAIAMLTKAVSLKSDFAEAYLLRGQILLEMGDAKSADDDVAWLDENVGEHEDVLLLKARTQAAMGQAEEAADTYAKLIEVNPFSIEAYRERGQIRYDRGDKAGAEADMQKVLELDPNSLADVSGDYSAEGIEERVRQAYSAVNPLGL